MQISKNLVIAREAVRAFNEGWLDCLTDMLAPDATYVDETRGITVQGPEAFKKTARELRGAIPGVLSDTRFEGDGDIVRARATIKEPGDFLEILEFDAVGKITKITARYQEPRVLTIPEQEMTAGV